MSKIPFHCQTTAIFTIWRCLSIIGNISTHHYTPAGWITHDVCQLCKTNPFHRTIHGDISLQPQILPTPPPTPSRFCLFALSDGPQPVASGPASARFVSVSRGSVTRRSRGRQVTRRRCRRRTCRNHSTFAEPGEYANSNMKNKPISWHYEVPHAIGRKKLGGRAAKPPGFLLTTCGRWRWSRRATAPRVRRFRSPSRSGT